MLHNLSLSYFMLGAWKFKWENSETKPWSAYLLLLLSKFPLLCNYRVIKRWKQFFIWHKFFMKLKIRSYILYYMLSIFIQCILHSLLLSLTLIFFHRRCGGRRSYCWRIKRIISFFYIFFSLLLETILTAYEKGFTKGLFYPC